ncbi:channel-forming protein, partial [Mycobacterium tuberculosis]
DEIEDWPGRLTVFLAPHDLINGGHVGHYGTGHGAMSVTVSQ